MTPLEEWANAQDKYKHSQKIYGLSCTKLENGRVIELPEYERGFFYLGKEIRIKKGELPEHDIIDYPKDQTFINSTYSKVINTPYSKRVFVQRGHSIVIEKGTQNWPIHSRMIDTINPLLCSASPRDIEDVLKWRKDIPYDKFYAKYHNEADAYKILRDYFLAHPEYTHMCVVPDDLVVKKEHIDKLMFEDLAYTDYPILAGVCNLDWQHQDLYSPCWKLTMDGFFKEEDLKGEPIKNPEYEGFACTFIRRDVLELFPLDGFNHTGVSFDLGLAVECYRRNIPIHVDCRVKMLHLKNRQNTGVLESCGIGIKSPTTIFEE